MAGSLQRFGLSIDNFEKLSNLLDAKEFFFDRGRNQLVWPAPQQIFSTNSMHSDTLTFRGKGFMLATFPLTFSAIFPFIPLSLAHPLSNYNHGAPKGFATVRGDNSRHFVAPNSGEIQVGGFVPITQQPTAKSQLRQRSHWTLFRR